MGFEGSLTVNQQTRHNLETHKGNGKNYHKEWQNKISPTEGQREAHSRVKLILKNLNTTFNYYTWNINLKKITFVLNIIKKLVLICENYSC